MLGKPRESLAWLEEIEDLNKEGKFENGSVIISEWIMDMARSKGKGSLVERLIALEDRYAKNGEVLPGRVVLKHILEELKPEMNRVANFDIENLAAVAYANDIRGFQAKWDRVNLHARTDVGFGYKHHCYYKQYLKIRGNADIEDDQNRYKRKVRKGTLTSDEKKY